MLLSGRHQLLSMPWAAFRKSRLYCAELAVKALHLALEDARRRREERHDDNYRRAPCTRRCATSCSTSPRTATCVAATVSLTSKQNACPWTRPQRRVVDWYFSAISGSEERLPLPFLAAEPFMALDVIEKWCASHCNADRTSTSAAASMRPPTAPRLPASRAPVAGPPDEAAYQH